VRQTHLHVAVAKGRLRRVDAQQLRRGQRRVQPQARVLAAAAGMGQQRALRQRRRDGGPLPAERGVGALRGLLEHADERLERLDERVLAGPRLEARDEAAQLGGVGHGAACRCGEEEAGLVFRRRRRLAGAVARGARARRLLLLLLLLLLLGVLSIVVVRVRLLLLLLLLVGRGRAGPLLAGRHQSRSFRFGCCVVVLFSLRARLMSDRSKRRARFGAGSAARGARDVRLLLCSKRLEPRTHKAGAPTMGLNDEGLSRPLGCLARALKESRESQKGRLSLG
jgi:hypothetical protein